MRSSSHTCMYLLDMSVGANIVLSSIIACNASVKFGYAGLIIAPLICGTIIGLINGIVYIKLHISSLIVTCALSLIYEALSVYTTNGKNVILSTEYRAFGDYPVNLILALIAYFLCAFILKYTKIGIYTYAIGSNEVVAKNMGVNVSKYKIVAFTLAGFMKGVPVEIEESAYIDGASLPKRFASVVFPLLQPAIVSCVITQGLWIWNDYFYPMVFISKKAQYSLPVGMLQFLGDKENPAQWNILFAACVLCALPLIIVFLALQKQFVNGIAAGAVKG